MRRKVFTIICIIALGALVYGSVIWALDLSRVKTWGSEVLTAADLNAEFDNILDHSIVNADVSATAAILASKIDFSAGLSSLAVTGDTTLTGDLAINGDDLTCDGVLTINATSATSFNDENITNVGQIDVDTIICDGAALTIGDNTETIAINSSDWDISTTGTITGCDGSNSLWTNDEGYITATLTQEQTEDYAGGMVASGTETRIAVSYDDGAGMLNFVVDDMNDDVPDAGDFGNATDLDANGALNTDCVAVAEFDGSQDWGDMSTAADGTVSLDTGVVAANESADDWITTADFAHSTDWGDISTGAAGSLTLDADVVAAAEMADADHGDFTWSSGTATLDTNVVADNEIDYSNVTLADFDYQTAWRVFYSDTNGDVTELGFGADGTVLTSTGAATAPAFEAAGGLTSVSQGDLNTALSEIAFNNNNGFSTYQVGMGVNATARTNTTYEGYLMEVYGNSDAYKGNQLMLNNEYAFSELTKKDAGNDNVYFQSRYVTATGIDLWIFLLVDKDTGYIKQASQAPDHPAYMCMDRVLDREHPFVIFDPNTDEIVVVEKAVAKEFERLSKEDGKSILEHIMSIFKCDMTVTLPYIPIHSGHWTANKEPIMIDSLPDYIKVRPLIDLTAKDWKDINKASDKRDAKILQEKTIEEAKKTSAKNKLKALGLTNDEIDALIEE